MQVRWIIPGVLLFALAPSSMAIGEEGCSDSETIRECWHRYASLPRKPQEVAAGDKALVESARENTQRLIEKQAGFESLGTGIASALSDFLPFLTARIDAEAVTQDESGLSIELNRFLFLPERVDENYRVSATFHDPDLFQPIVNALPAATRDDRVAALKKDLTTADDVSLLLTWSPVTKRMGRSHLKYSSVFSDLFSAAINRGVAAVPPSDPTALADWAAEVLEPVGVRAGLAPEVDPTTLAFDDAVFTSSPELRAQVESGLILHAKQEFALETAILEAARSSELFKFADLVNNQPQVVLAAGTRLRKKLAGPDEETIRVSYERGFVNVNSFEDEWESSKKDRSFLDFFTSYYNENQRSLEKGDRISFSVEYTHTDDYGFSSVADSISLSLPDEDQLSAGLVYGRYLRIKGFSDPRTDQTRIDFSANYDVFFDDPNRNDRAVVSATASRTLAAGFSLALGFAWANKPEFRGDVDHEVTANFGLNYKLDWDRGAK